MLVSRERTVKLLVALDKYLIGSFCLDFRTAVYFPKIVRLRRFKSGKREPTLHEGRHVVGFKRGDSPEIVLGFFQAFQFVGVVFELLFIHHQPFEIGIGGDLQMVGISAGNRVPLQSNGIG